MKKAFNDVLYAAGRAAALELDMNSCKDKNGYLNIHKYYAECISANSADPDFGIDDALRYGILRPENGRLKVLSPFKDEFEDDGTWQSTLIEIYLDIYDKRKENR